MYSTKTERNSESHKIRILRAENKRLRQQIAALKSELRGANGRIVPPQNEFHARFSAHARNERLFSKKHYSAYVYNLIRHTSIFNLYSRIIHVVRRYTFIRLSLKIITALLALIESGAVLVLSASFFLISLPITVIISYVALLFTALRGERINKELRQKMKNKRITVFFPPKRGAMSKGSFFYGMLAEAASTENCFCVVVSPFFWSSRAPSGEKGKPYLIARMEKNNVIIIRRHYYFTLKKRVFNTLSSSFTEIY